MTALRLPWRPQDCFLRAFARTGSVSQACRVSGVPRRTVYNWRDADADFRRRWGEARGRGVQFLHDEAVRRAFEGDEQPVWRDGHVVGRVGTPDNRVLWRLLQSLHAENYGPDAAARRAERGRAAEMTRRLDEADKRVAAYEASLGRPNTDRGK